MLDAEKVIEEVRKFPVLYDQSTEKYRNFEYKEKIWKIIATNLQLEGGAEECKRKWSSVRDQLRRTLQKRKTKSAHKNRKYKYEDILTFLVPHLWEREGISNVPKLQDDGNESVDDKREDFAAETCQQRTADVEPITEGEIIPGATRDNSFRSIHVFGNKDNFVKPKALKRKIPRPEETLRVSPSRQLMAFILAEKKAALHDPVDAFLGGISPSLKLLNPHLLNEAKGRIFGVVQEMELRQLQMNANGHLTNLRASSPSSDASPRDEVRHPNGYLENL